MALTFIGVSSFLAVAPSFTKRRQGSPLTLLSKSSSGSHRLRAIQAINFESVLPIFRERSIRFFVINTPFLRCTWKKLKKSKEVLALCIKKKKRKKKKLFTKKCKKKKHSRDTLLSSKRCPRTRKGALLCLFCRCHIGSYNVLVLQKQNIWQVNNFFTRNKSWENFLPEPDYLSKPILQFPLPGLIDGTRENLSVPIFRLIRSDRSRKCTSWRRKQAETRCARKVPPLPSELPPFELIHCSWPATDNRKPKLLKVPVARLWKIIRACQRRFARMHPEKADEECKKVASHFYIHRLPHGLKWAA